MTTKREAFINVIQHWEARQNIMERALQGNYRDAHSREWAAMYKHYSNVLLVLDVLRDELTFIDRNEIA